MQIKSRESIYIRKVTRLAFLVCSLGKLSEGQLYHLANRCCKLFLKPLTLILPTLLTKGRLLETGVSFRNPLRWPITIINSVDKAKSSRNILTNAAPQVLFETYHSVIHWLFTKLICSNSFANVLLITSCQASRKC